VSPGKRSTSRSVRRPRDDGENMRQTVHPNVRQTSRRDWGSRPSGRVLQLRCRAESREGGSGLGGHRASSCAISVSERRLEIVRRCRYRMALM
jgi:hypothetical protein